MMNSIIDFRQVRTCDCVCMCDVCALCVLYWIDAYFFGQVIDYQYGTSRHTVLFHFTTSQQLVLVVLEILIGDGMNSLR